MASMVKNTTSFGRGVCARAFMGASTSRQAALARRLLFIDLSWSVGLLALCRRSGGKAERGCDGDSPSFIRPDENPLGDAARRRVLLGDGVAIGPVHDSRTNRND